MKSASKEFKVKMNKDGCFYQTAKIVFADGREKELDRKDFYISGNSYSDGPGASSFPLGEAMAKSITLSLVNDDDRFSDYDFYMSKITTYLRSDLSETTESILMGTFTVTTPEAYGSQVEIVAIDDMYKGDKEYSSNISFPATIRQMLLDSCQTCGVQLVSTSFENDSFSVRKKPENITHRQLWGMIAMIAGGNARMDEYNRLEIISYDFSHFEKEGLDGGNFDTNNPYASGDVADGGNFTDYSSGDSFDGGRFEDADDYHFFYQNKTPYIATDDVVITGVQTNVDDESYIFGDIGYVISIENQLLNDAPQNALELIGEKIVGLKFRPFTIDHTAYPLAEFGDICYVADRKGNVYQSVVTDISFTYFGYTTISCSANDPLRNSSKYYSDSAEAIVAARREREKEMTAYDLAVQQLTNLMTQSFGVFKTEEPQEDGSIIYYLHNKPELSSSSTIWKMTADAFAVSTDGGKTWKAGMDSEGNAVVNILSAVGINFDWAHGGTLTLGGYNNEDGKLEVYDASGKLVGYWTKDGLYAENAYIEGTIKSNNAIITGGDIQIETDDSSHSIIKLNSNLAYPDGITYAKSSAKFAAQGLSLADEHNLVSDVVARREVEYYYSAAIYKYYENNVELNRAAYRYHGLAFSYLGSSTGYMSNASEKCNLYVNGTTTLGSSPIISSDRDLKEHVAYLEPEESANFIYSLKPAEFLYKDNNSERHHKGLYAQEVKESMGEKDWGLYIDGSINTPVTMDEEGNEVKVPNTFKGLRYEELIPDLIATIQSLNERIKALEKGC